jgi:hypothetical protein
MAQGAARTDWSTRTSGRAPWLFNKATIGGNHHVILNRPQGPLFIQFLLSLNYTTPVVVSGWSCRSLRKALFTQAE